MSAQSDISSLLTPEENDTVITVIGHRKQSKATAVVQLFEAVDKTSWKKFRTGVVCFVKDNLKKSYYIRLVDIGTRSIVFEQELYNQFTYKRDCSYFHSFPGERYMIGLNFADEQEADHFGNAVDTKIRERTEKRTEKRSTSAVREHHHQPDVAMIGRPPVEPIHDGNDPFAAGNRKGKLKRPKKKINKTDIGLPSDFRHLAHVGFDPQTGAFDSDNITPEWKKLLDTVGVTNEQLEDKNTAEFIYDFVEKHGGIEEANRQLDLQKRAAPPPPSHRGPTRKGNRGLPPPPPRDVAPPPPSRHGPPPGGNIPAPPPPPPIGVPQPPPPPPVAPSGGGGPEPPPPPQKPSGGGGLPPPVPDARTNLLSSIRAGVQLKSVTQEGDHPAGEEVEGMAGALARALALRSNVIHQSDDESESEESEEDDWD